MSAEQGVLDGITPAELTVDEAIETAVDITRRADADNKPTKRYLLVSGGNDSAVLLDLMAAHADEIVHINTGIGIPETTGHVRRVVRRYDLPYREIEPPHSYEWLVLNRWNGLPGPGAHRFTYTMLKERCIEALLRSDRSYRGERFVLLTGARSAESKRRMGTADEIRRKGGQVWVNPLQHWSNAAMREYREGRALPENEVSANLHMSGECLCGAMADQGPERSEREAIRFFYPDFDRRLADIERMARDAGLPYTEWGVKRCDESASAGPMCQGCEYRTLWQSAAPTDGEQHG